MVLGFFRIGIQIQNLGTIGFIHSKETCSRRIKLISPGFLRIGVCFCEYPIDNIDPLEDRKYRYFWIFPHHSCENIQKYFEFLDTFGYSPIISEQLSDVLGGRSPP